MSDDVIGSVFVSNYPPYAAWSEDALPAVLQAVEAPPAPDTPLGLYVHVPFCRKRCRFCYYKVFTDTPSAEIRHYVDALSAEAGQWARLGFVGGREVSFLYFGGGTPSYLSTDQLRQLFGAVRGSFRMAQGAEITFECEPGTLREAKVEVLRELGVTRLSIGVESFNHEVLEINGRAHGASHIEPAYRLAREAGFERINLDLIAGMVGETEPQWLEGVRRTIDLEPDSVTIYQLEIPGNTWLAKTLMQGGDPGGAVVDIPTRRRWAGQAFELLEEAGYTVVSGYTAVRGDPAQSFVYRDSLWHGADLVPLGVSAFGHIGGVHLQNDKDRERYVAAIGEGRLALQRGYLMSDEQRLIRELVLQLKLGRVSAGYFTRKFGVDIVRRFARQWAGLDGLVRVDGDNISLSRDGLLQVDRLLSPFFLQEHGGLTSPGGAT